MHYIRFLKTPKVQEDSSSVLLKAVITVTTDLGETFYAKSLQLVATVRSPLQKGDIYLRRVVQWPGRGARSLPITFDLSRQDIAWPACVHVAVKSTGAAGLPGFLPSIVDVWSGAMNPSKRQFESGWRVERRFLNLAGHTVSLLEDAGDSIARHLWDGSQALAQHIDHALSLQTPSSPLPLLEHVLVSATYRRLHVVELGCGCGSVGIVLAQGIPDCDVILTDLPEVTELVEANIERMKPATNSRVHFEPLDWEQPLPETLQNRPTELIIVSECTYNTDTLKPLVNTLRNFTLQNPKAVIIVSTKTRHDSEKEFFTFMEDAGFIEDGSMRLPLPGEPGDGYADWATDVGLHIFHSRESRLSSSPREDHDEKVSTADLDKQSRSD